ncbi:MAG: ROK family protein [Paludibacteraceae bacterium]|nr:ROK family protein [Paludibacteraceae bacterium]
MIVGVDMGGTTTKFGLVKEDGTVVARGSVPTRGSVEEYVESLCLSIEGLAAAQADSGFRGVGMGCPNGNIHSGNIEYAVNLPWKGVVPIARLVGERLHVPCHITNDANAAALGEMFFGAASGLNDFIMITLGTGVGGGIVSGGRLIYGHDGFAGELGHVIVERGGRTCGCGRKGCLETYCSATGVSRSAFEKTGRSWTSKQVSEAAADGAQWAREVLEETGDRLGSALADFVSVLSPEAIVLAGGLSRAGDLLIGPVRKAMDENLMPVWKGKIRILSSALPPDDAGVLGAASLMMER